MRRLKSNPTTREDIKIRKANLKKNTALFRRDFFVNDKGLLRDGGRIIRADAPFHIKHPVIIPRKGYIMSLVIRYYHQRINHQGRGITFNEVSEGALCIIGESSVVASEIHDQIRHELDTSRTVDYFGPLYIKDSRKELKRYGVLFTCLSLRAIHLETAKSLETDSFINNLRCFPAGHIQQLRKIQQLRNEPHRSATRITKSFN